MLLGTNLVNGITITTLNLKVNTIVPINLHK